MPNFSNLDRQRRLSPWSLQEHADYVLGQYGSIVALDPNKAEDYLLDYEKKEKEYEVAYEFQCENIKNSQRAQGAPPQELLPLVKLDWNPRKRLAENAQKTKKPVESEETAEKPAKKVKKASK